VMSLLQYKTFIRMQLLNNNNDNKWSGSLMKINIISCLKRDIYSSFMNLV
jgi:hypothetical protein